MESDSFALRTALFVLLGALLLAIAWVMLSEQQGEYRPYLVVTDQSVSGLALQSKVYYKGVEAGTIADIYFDERDFDHVRILVHINRDIPVANNTFARLALRGITGEYDLRLENDGPLGAPLTTSAGMPAIIAMRAEYITQLASSSERVLADISEASARLATLLSDDNQREIRRLVTSAAHAAEQFAALGELAVPTLQQLPTLVDEATRTMADVRSVAQDLGAGVSASDAAISNFATASESVDRLARQLRTATLPEVAESLIRIDRASTELALLLEELRQDPQRLLIGAPGPNLGPGESARREAP